MPRAIAFEDTIDGYFPLQLSISELMTRRDLTAACLLIEHAPIMEIPCLPPDAPVPLNIRAGRAGMIDRLVLCVEGGSLSGFGSWRWLSGPPPSPLFEPMTRLAEPAFLHGVAYPAALPAHGTATPFGPITKSGQIEKIETK